MDQLQGHDRRRELEDQLIDRIIANPSLRAELRSQPGAVLERELGIRLPDGVRVCVHEDSELAVNLVIPGQDEARQLTPAELDAVAGAQCGKDQGWWGKRK